MVEDCRRGGAGAGGLWMRNWGRWCRGVLDTSGVREEVSVKVGIWAECVGI